MDHPALGGSRSFLFFFKVRAVQIHNYHQCHLIAYQRAPREQSGDARVVAACQRVRLVALNILYVCVQCALSLDGFVKFQIKPYLDVRADRLHTFSQRRQVSTLGFGQKQRHVAGAPQVEVYIFNLLVNIHFCCS
jgi:hypothetical protein